MIQKNYCLKRDAPIDFLGPNENTDHICLEINKSALTKNLPCDIRRKRFKIFGNKNLSIPSDLLMSDHCHEMITKCNVNCAKNQVSSY